MTALENIDIKSWKLREKEKECLNLRSSQCLSVYLLMKRSVSSANSRRYRLFVCVIIKLSGWIHSTFFHVVFLSIYISIIYLCEANPSLIVRRKSWWSTTRARIGQSSFLFFLFRRLTLTVELKELESWFFSWKFLQSCTFQKCIGIGPCQQNVWWF